MHAKGFGIGFAVERLQLSTIKERQNTEREATKVRPKATAQRN
jgi:hypothetical protein